MVSYSKRLRDSVKLSLSYFRTLTAKTLLPVTKPLSLCLKLMKRFWLFHFEKRKKHIRGGVSGLAKKESDFSCLFLLMFLTLQRKNLFLISRCEEVIDIGE